ncbi:MAG: hypothetical protein WC956_07180 [bacterium]
MIRFIVRTLIFIVEKLMNELALIAALLTLGQQGSAHERLIGGSRAIGFVLRDFGLAVYHNTPFSQVMGGMRTGIDNAIDGIVKSIEGDPQTALVAAIGTFFTYKLLPYFLRIMRRALKKGRRSSDIAKAPKPPKPSHAGNTSASAVAEKSPTYQKLYRDR